MDSSEEEREDSSEEERGEFSEEEPEIEKTEEGAQPVPSCNWVKNGVQ